MEKINWKYEPNKDSTLSSSAPVLLFEKRVLTVVTLSIILGIITWLIAVSTDYWFITVYYNHTELLWTHSGLWKKCDIDVTHVKSCEYLSQNEYGNVINVATVLLLISLSCGFSVYSLLVFISRNSFFLENTMIFIVDDIWTKKCISTCNCSLYSVLIVFLSRISFLIMFCRVYKSHPTFKDLF